MATELVGGAFLSASLQVLFDRLASREVLNLIQAKKLQKTSFDQLEATLYAASALLNDAEYKQISDPAAKNWLDKLRDVVYQADDLLDEISIQAVTQQQEVRNLFSRSLDYLHYREVGSKIDDITQKLESIVQHKDILGLEKGERGNLWKPDQSTSLVEPSEVYGRDTDKEDVINFLLDDTSDSNFSVIPIWGMGGIGKTTLAQLAYNDDRVKQKFNPKGWVCVSEEDDAFKITKSIINAVNSGLCVDKDLNLLQLDLKDKLSGNKFLIVLDDVWNLDYAKWILLQKPFHHGAKGSKIILTTRTEEVASIVQTIPHYHHHLSHLSEEDSWSLFEKHAFASMDLGVRSSLEQIGRDIVKKCQGLPLAIQALGGLLRSQPNTKDWKNVLKSLMWNLPKSNIFPALRLSYHYLPPQLKQCFAYCSLFPKDHKFDKDELILLWMAEGLLESSKTGMTLEEVGSKYFDTLTSRSFFQRSKGRQGFSCFIMHDLIHDLSILVAGEFYQRLEVEQDVNKITKKTRHLSWGAYHQATFIEALHGVELESVRTLICWGHPWLAMPLLSPNGLSAFYSKFKCLRALSFFYFRNLNMLPESIEQLIHLRYLDMSATNITSLPESLCKLYNLQTLKLFGCRNLTRLPNNMQDLANLRYLDIRSCPLTGMPKGMSKLNNLQYLSDFIVGKDGATMEELGAPPNLCKELCIDNLEYVSSGKEAFEAKLKDKKQLENLSLLWSSSSHDTMDGSETERDILDKLQPHSNLKALTIEGYRGTRFPNWLGDPSYCNIVDLRLSNCRNCFMLPPLGQLPSLKKLIISRFENVVRIGEEFYKSDQSSSSSVTPTPFESLEFLYFSAMPALQEWYCIEAAFPKLQQLQIFNCPKLESCLLLQGNQEFPKSLETLIIWGNCDSIKSFPTDRFPNLKRLDLRDGSYGSVKCFPENGLLPSSLTRLSLGGFSSLETFDSDTFRHLPSLQRITINDCPNLQILEVQRLAAFVKDLFVLRCPQLEVEELSCMENVRFG